MSQSIDTRKEQDKAATNTPASTSDNERRLMFIHALTPLHPGAGTAMGSIDLPVQRERHTGWPLIPGSTVKGVLRHEHRVALAKNSVETEDILKKADALNEIEALFGPARHNRQNEWQGALSITDARLLAFPVRSVCGLFGWVTCPHALERFARDARVAGFADTSISGIASIEPCIVSNSPLKARDNGQGSVQVVFEEFDFTLPEDDKLTAFAKWLSGQLQCSRLESRLAVVRDDDFAYFARHATEVASRIALEYETKTAVDGALFYEELVPTETIFYSLLMWEKPEKRKLKEGEDERHTYSIKHLTEALGKEPIIQIGGDATVGKGLCAISFAGAKAEVNQQ